VPDDLAAAMLTHRSQFVYGALEAIERVGLASRDYLEREIVIVATDFTPSHSNLLVRGRCPRSPSALPLEVLHCPFVFLRGGSGLERAQVPPLARSGILLPRIEPVLTG
jgi:hypothetical protein